MAKVKRIEDIKQWAVITIVTGTQCLLVDLSPPYVVASFYLASRHDDNTQCVRCQERSLL
jgi:hypothetical protein